MVGSDSLTIEEYLLAFNFVKVITQDEEKDGRVGDEEGRCSMDFVEKLISRGKRSNPYVSVVVMDLLRPRPMNYHVPHLQMSEGVQYLDLYEFANLYVCSNPLFKLQSILLPIVLQVSKMH